MNCIGYTRVSTHEQGISGAGLAAQRSAIAAAAEAHGWTEVTYIEDVASGKDTARPGLEKARALLGRGDVLVVSRADRLSRSLLDFVTLMQVAQKDGWSLLALDLPDTTTVAGEAMANVMLVFAQMERRLASERTKSALAEKRAQGVTLGRPRQIPESVRDRIKREREKRRTLREIAENLEADGVATVNGGRWHASTVRAVLNYK